MVVLSSTKKRTVQNEYHQRKTHPFEWVSDCNRNLEDATSSFTGDYGSFGEPGGWRGPFFCVSM